MKQERVILSFIMVLIGLLIAGVAFFLYESSKTITPPKQSLENSVPSPTPDSSFFLSVNSPQDESIVNNKTVKISGKTDPNATVVILTPSGQEVLKPSSQGDFTTTLQIDEGVNYIKIQAINPNGEMQFVDRVVSYTSEEF